MEFFEMPLAFFVRIHPEMIPMIGSMVDLNDPDYIIRFNGDRYEFGYASDSWMEFNR